MFGFDGGMSMDDDRPILVNDENLPLIAIMLLERINDLTKGS